MFKRQQAHTFESQTSEPGGHLPYLLYLPTDYDPARHWPLVLFLHGMGERGTDLKAVTSHGPARLVEEGQDFPFLLVSPQCPDPDQWFDYLPVLPALLDEITQNYAVDPQRIAVTGLSMGGFGTWMLAINNPQRFSAIAPICGGGDTSQACTIKHLPVWAFHGAKDPVIPVQLSQRMVEALQTCGGNVKLTIYPEAGHDSWTQTYANPELYMWLLKQRAEQ